MLHLYIAGMMVEQNARQVRQLADPAQVAGIQEAFEGYVASRIQNIKVNGIPASPAIRLEASSLEERFDNVHAVDIHWQILRIWCKRRWW